MHVSKTILAEAEGNCNRKKYAELVKNTLEKIWSRSYVNKNYVRLKMSLI